jgi:hypothetical protein
MNAVTPTEAAKPAEAAKPIDLETRTAQYVKLRDLIKEKEEAFKKEIAPAKALLEQLNGLLLNHLNTLGIDSAASGAGTVYRKTVVSVTMPDPAAFREFVVGNELFDLADIRPAKKAIEDFITGNKAPPPGVNFSTAYDVGVRRGKEAEALPPKGEEAPASEDTPTTKRTRRTKASA